MPGPTSWSGETDTLCTTSTEMTLIPPPTKSSSSTSAGFRSLTVSNTGLGNLILSPPGSSSTLFYVKNSHWPGNPSVTLSLGAKEGRILGVLKLGVFSENTVGLGDPNRDQVFYEALRRVSNWTHGTYEFEFGGMGERRRFTWQRTRQPIFGDQPDMELRENVESNGTGEVLATYKGCQGFLSRTRGTFYLRKGVDRQAGVEKKLEDWSNWELIVLLTGCGIIEGSRRRARARRSGGGGG
ncbi:hypothetical protein N431DRAFT_430788 [Stipitochalara longipes BDJ]|nr:hypothetical protein N431DRAFT_430788 [Stipitochalara longipes BDJ]